MLHKHAPTADSVVLSPDTARNIWNGINGTYIILGGDAAGASEHEENGSSDTDSGSEMLMTHAYQLINLSMFVFERKRSSTTLSTPLHEIFAASVSSLNVWLDNPRVWRESTIVSALHEEIEVLQNLCRNYEALGKVFKSLHKVAGGADEEQFCKLWDGF